MKYTTLGNTGFQVSRIGYGGIVSSQHFDGVTIPGDGQALSNQYVSYALSQGINYFDVAPGYGDAQLLMGNSLAPHRKDVYLACKTNQRERAVAEKEMEESLRLLHTDYFDVYQLHGLKTVEELDTCFGPGGTMELLEEMKKKGIARKIGFTAHSEAVALKALTLYDFDTVMFPLNWHMHLAHDMGEDLRKIMKEKGIGLLGIKSMIKRAWKNQEERLSSPYPKSWCSPFSTQEESEYLKAAMAYTLSLGVDVLIPPGNISHFTFACEHLEEVLSRKEEGYEILLNLLPEVKDYPFYEPLCYEK
ncbi:MAG: aldo/keto reductase [Aeriscardovia sp.]|nr:aldo/keto reductase [Aeriscardovia sp.]